MAVVIYARVSTDDKEQNPERQLMKCRQYCELHDHKVIAELVDHHTGDSNLSDRPEAKKIFELRPKGLVFSSVDRLTRQHPSKMMGLLAFLKDSGITPISATEPAFNLESDFAEVIIYIMGYFNNYYLKELKKNVKMGLERARLQGKVIGRPKAKFNKYRAYELLFKQCKSLDEVARELGTSKATIHRFKKVAEKNPDSFIKNLVISKTGDKETNGGLKK